MGHLTTIVPGYASLIAEWRMLLRALPTLAEPRRLLGALPTVGDRRRLLLATVPTSWHGSSHRHWLFFQCYTRGRCASLRFATGIHCGDGEALLH